MRTTDRQAWQQLLQDTDCPAGHLTGFEIDGYLVAIHTAPKALTTDEWLRGIFHGQPPAKLPQPVTAALWHLSNDIASAVRADSYRLPRACRRNAQSLRAWQHGFSHGLTLTSGAWLLRLESLAGLESSLQLVWRMLTGTAETQPTAMVAQTVCDYQAITNMLRDMLADRDSAAED